MKFSKRGIATTGKITIAVGLVLIIAAGVYAALGPNLLGVAPKGTQTTTPSNGGSGQPKSILDLFNTFSRMTFATGFADFEDGEIQNQGSLHISYVVLGRAVVNSTNYYKVQFTNSDARTSAIAWINPRGLVDRVDVLGDKNYSGSAAQVYAQAFLGALSPVPSLGYNITLLSGLQKIAEGSQGIGPTQVDVVTYGLRAPTSTYTNYTVKIATVPGVSFKLAVYVYQEFPSKSNNFFEVTSVTKA